MSFINQLKFLQLTLHVVNWSCWAAWTCETLLSWSRRFRLHIVPTCLFSFVSGAEIHRSEPWLAQIAAGQTSIRKATVHFNTLNRRRCIQGLDSHDQSLPILNMCKYVYCPIDPSVIKTKLLCFSFCGSDTRRTKWRPQRR